MSTLSQMLPRLCACLLILLVGAGPVRAQTERRAPAPDAVPDAVPEAVPAANPSIAWKLSLGRYQDPADGVASDINLRGNLDDLTFWVGHYNGAEGFQQTRVGIERQDALPLGRVISSLQAASGGFLGGSLTWDLRTSHEPLFAPLVGWGRTHAKTYYNLNFDPNDAYTVGGSFSLPAKGLLSVFLVADDRFGTGQRVTHAVYRAPLGSDMRLTVDLFARQGRSDPDAPRVAGTGLGVGLDWRDYFLKFTHDERANFTSANMNRLVTGLRF